MDSAELLDAARTHQFAAAKRRGVWDVVETAQLKQAKAEINRLNEELEHQVIEWAGELTAINEELRKEISERTTLQVERDLLLQRLRLQINRLPLGGPECQRQSDQGRPSHCLRVVSTPRLWMRMTTSSGSSLWRRTPEVKTTIER